MLYGLMLTIGSLIYLIILMIIYYSKNYFDTAQNRIYRYMLFISMVYLVFQIISVLAIYYSLSYGIIFVTWRISWSASIVWFEFFYFYFIAFINNDNSDSFLHFLKKRKFCMGMAIFILIAIIAYFVFLPFEKPSVDNMTYLPGSTAYIVFSFCLLLNIFIVGNLIKNIKNVSKRDIFVISISLAITIVLMLIQMSYQSIAIIPIGFALGMYLYYFTTENPDLLLLKKTKEVSDEVEKSNKIKLDFLSNVSYEIKNPMDSISSLTDTLINTPFNVDSTKNYLKQICNSGSDLLDITNNILDLSTIETGTNLVKNKNYNPSEMISRLVDIIKNKLGYSKIHFNVSVDTNLPTIVNGDESKVYQCVLNILTNAVKYTEIGKITFTVTSKREGNNVRILFKVMDTGIGIKEEDRKYLFEKFSRLDDAVIKEIEGSGLGLTIAKKYLDLMGGKIWFESQHLAGSTFFIEIVQTIVDPTPIRNIAFNTEKINYSEGYDCSNCKLLVVDDDELNVKVLSRMLERYKLKFDYVEDGDKCITKIKSDEKYDLIFMDDNLPNITGTETMKLLKELAGNELPPVIILTANAILGMKEQYLSEGFNDYLSKPIDMQELDKIINKYLKK
ncbi:MAG: hybrid sensor histidine kinase/response regulator [Bacilli bacterium]